MNYEQKGQKTSNSDLEKTYHTHMKETEMKMDNKALNIKKICLSY
jgi:hypothetical protein